MGFLKRLTANPFNMMRTYSAVAGFYELLQKKKKGEVTVSQLIMDGAIEPILELAPVLAPELTIVDDVVNKVTPVIGIAEVGITRFKEVTKQEPNIGQEARLLLRRETQQYEMGVDD